jgi:hypothetical protein
MALILIDGCEDVTSWVNSGSTLVAARNTNGIQVTNGNTLSYPIPTAEQTDTLTLGFALFPVNSGATINNFLRINSDSGATNHLTLAVGGTAHATLPNALILYRGTTAGTAIITSAANVVASSVWAFIELQVKMHDTTGTATLKVNGVTVGSPFTGDTKNGGTKTVWDYIQFLGVSALTVRIDDLYLDNAATYWGDVTVDTLYPNGNGDASAWVGSDADSTNNYLLVDEVGAPVTSDYVNTPTAGAQDLYALTDLTGTKAVLAVQHCTYALKTDSAARSIKLLNRRSATNASAAQALTTAFAGYHWIQTTDPETAAAWTVADVNALQSGVEAV